MNVLNVLMGGALIGLAASVMLYFLGRITGISGIVLQGMVNAVSAFKRDDAWRREFWRYSFLLGLVGGAWAAHAVLGAPLPQVSESGFAFAAVAGFIVGIGTSVGSGCTSGHGICGLSRFSVRSLAATGLFMASAMITVFVTRHVMGV